MSSGLRAVIFHHKNKTERRLPASALYVHGGANHPLIFANQRTPMSETETRELLKEQKRMVFHQGGGHRFVLQANQCFFYLSSPLNI